MRPLSIIAGVAAIVAAVAVNAAPSTYPSEGKPAGAACAPEAGYTFICDLPEIEDMIATGDGKTIIAASYAVPGRLFQIDPRTKQVSILYSGQGTVEPDLRAFPSCPGAPDPALFHAHGITLRQQGGSTLLYVVNHGGRESVEVFRLSPNFDTATWIGCVPMPEGTMGNAVVALEDGGIAVTNFGRPSPDLLERTFRGEITGDVREWHRDRGWRTVAQSAMSAANGMEVSADNRFLYVAASGTRTLYRFDRSKGEVKHSGTLDFIPDNIRRAPDGRLFVTGYKGTADEIRNCVATPKCLTSYKVLIVDPHTLNTEVVADRQVSPNFGSAAVGMIVDGQLWVGPSRGDRIAILPAP